MAPRPGAGSLPCTPLCSLPCSPLRVPPQTPEPGFWQPQRPGLVLGQLRAEHPLLSPALGSKEAKDHREWPELPSTNPTSPKAAKIQEQPHWPVRKKLILISTTAAQPAHTSRDAVSAIHRSRAISLSSASPLTAMEKSQEGRESFKAPLPSCFGLLPFITGNRGVIAQGTGELMVPCALEPQCQVEMGEQMADWGLPDNLSTQI